MRKPLLLAGILFSVLLATGALAQDPWGRWDVLGIFTDEGQHCGFPGEGYGHAYLVLTDMLSPSGVGGWECRLDHSGDAIITSVSRGTGIDADSEALGFAVGLAEPIPYSDWAVLAEIEYRSVGGTGYLYVRPNRTPSIPGHAVYVAGDDPLDKRPMSPFSGDWDTPVFAVNHWITPVVDTTWGQVKALFR